MQGKRHLQKESLILVIIDSFNLVLLALRCVFEIHKFIDTDVVCAFVRRHIGRVLLLMIITIDVIGGSGACTPGIARLDRYIVE